MQVRYGPICQPKGGAARLQEPVDESKHTRKRRLRPRLRTSDEISLQGRSEKPIGRVLRLPELDRDCFR